MTRYLQGILDAASQVQFVLLASAAFFIRGYSFWTRKEPSLAIVRWSFGGFVLVMWGGQYALLEKWLQFSLAALALIVEIGIVVYLVVASLKTNRCGYRHFPLN